METVESFVRRTRGPVVPFLRARYPWGYACDYLRVELPDVPPELVAPPVAELDVRAAVGLVRQWCARTGEPPHGAATRLADAYLERWGMEPVGTGSTTGVTVAPHYHPSNGRAALPSATGPDGHHARDVVHLIV